MTKRKLNALAAKWWNIGVAAIKEKYPDAGYGTWRTAPERQRHGWCAVVQHAIKTLKAKKP